MTNPDHPYKMYEKSAIWKTLERGIDELVKNGDLTEQTARTHIIGYLTKLLVEQPPSSAKLRAVKKKMEELGYELADVDLANR